MFERFTKPARAAVVQAQQRARDMQARQIRPEHVLFAVIDTATGRVARVLTEAGITVDDIVSGGPEPGGPLGADDADALKAIGIDLAAVRESVEAHFGDGAFNGAGDEHPGRTGKRGHIPFSKPGKKVLELSLREAIARGDNFIGTEHILLGLLRGADPAVVKAVAPHTSPAALRAHINQALDAAA
ncbi:Clp protease N-terminal domain-containing protein [Spelaeicoccus albus]|uniref:ATP-dependent Clp protease ATP-binding subunit ClpA n=1 Tax=Spelaeicoccus albus TaxID=1280376 RepID=A0A7Z0D2A1_9MICO|nr:Clp protease N-terminal domain-containing protein [Spelaeicoccus albus]NYI67558.1 ATP-dependent Clp protease ATP-binding subunit ClpA [Spelaeicoccus albus]